LDFQLAFGTVVKAAFPILCGGCEGCEGLINSWKSFAKITFLKLAMNPHKQTIIFQSRTAQSCAFSDLEFFKRLGPLSKRTVSLKNYE